MERQWEGQGTAVDRQSMAKERQWNGSGKAKERQWKDHGKAVKWYEMREEERR